MAEEVPHWVGVIPQAFLFLVPLPICFIIICEGDECVENLAKLHIPLLRQIQVVKIIIAEIYKWKWVSSEVSNISKSLS